MNAARTGRFCEATGPAEFGVASNSCVGSRGQRPLRAVGGQEELLGEDLAGVNRILWTHRHFFSVVIHNVNIACIYPKLLRWLSSAKPKSSPR